MENIIKTTEDIIKEVMSPMHRDAELFERSVVKKLMEVYAEEKIKSSKEKKE